MSKLLNVFEAVTDHAAMEYLDYNSTAEGLSYHADAMGVSLSDSEVAFLVAKLSEFKVWEGSESSAFDMSFTTPLSNFEG